MRLLYGFSYKKFLVSLLSLLSFVTTAGSQPKFSITPTTSTSMTIPNTGSAFVNYTVTNNTALTRTLTMVPIAGLTQDTTAGFCTNPFTLAPGASCTLHLVVNGATAPTHITGGPEICKTMGPNNNAPDPFLCSTACGSNQLNLQVVFLLSLVVTPVNPTIKVGETQQFTATGYYSDGSSLNLTTAATWASSNLIVAPISNLPGSQGLAIGLTPGMTTISATAFGLTGMTTLTVVPYFAYVVNASVSTVSKCPIDLSTAVDTCSDSGVGNIFGPDPQYIAINPNKTIAYVTNKSKNTITRCNIDQLTGDFVSCDFPQPAPIGIVSAEGVAIDPSDSYIYFADAIVDTITQCPLSDFNGCTNACVANSCNTIDQPMDIAITPNGRFAYIVNVIPPLFPVVTVCQVNAITGTFDPCTNSGANSLDAPRGIGISPSGLFAYITNTGPSNSVTVCTINSSNGSLTNCVDSGANNINAPMDIELNRTSNFAYITNFNGSTITQCLVNPSTGLMVPPCINSGLVGLTNPIGIALG